MRDANTIHTMLHLLMDYPDISEKHKAMWEALSGMGLVTDHEVPDTLTKNQCKSIVLEYVHRLYEGTGNS